MRHKLSVLILTILLTACGRSTEVVKVETIETKTVETTDSVQRIVDNENDYRLGLGQTMLSQGLSCTVQLIASGGWLSTSSAGYPGSGAIVVSGSSYAYLFKDAFNQADGPGSSTNTLIPSQIRPIFQNQNFKISCSGQIVVTESGYYTFEMASDDGSILTVDGTQIINNDGNHGVVTKSGTKYLREGVRTFSLQYAQSGGGSYALTLKANGSAVSGSVFYH